MNYLYENLGPERFQEFCQSLILQGGSEIQCLPVAQPDGGRDAIRYMQRPRGEFAVYQVKFARDPSRQDDPAEWVEKAITAELPKIEKLVKRGAVSYYLVTNVAGTSHLPGGSIERVNAFLQKSVSVPSQCWWRDDLNRRLDAAWDLKWAYPELLSGVDMFRLLVESGLGEDRSRRSNAVRAFLRAQFDADSQVKFRQIELQSDLLSLFVDVPARLLDNRSRKRPRHTRQLSRQFGQDVLVEPDNADDIPTYDEPALLAAALLFHAKSGELIPRLVIEGAPGQGKSTVAQYICQVNRIRLLALNSELERLPPAHAVGMIRLPMKVDLRDLATWFDKRNPFDADAEEGLPENWDRSLESFLAAQVHHLSGGAEFSVSDLQAVLSVSATLLVFDGLDEVADIASRTEIVKEVEQGVRRLDEVAASLQVVVTTRPAAFSNSPGFSPADYVYCELVELPRSLIEKYSERWLAARHLGQQEASEVRRLLATRLELPHIRELARNPMQLAILLSVVHTKGVSLPDKRTALYDTYIEIFLDREAEKSTVVRDYRDILVDVHRYLGWFLHSAAERGEYRRGIPTDELRSLVGGYLATEGQDSALIDKLFHGVVERVVALVSRVEGTFEFEVQPLREYFAAKHLYETAPLSPPGNEARGTKPERFDALARDFYWLNVVRFYSGCYGKGELPSLVQGLEELSRTDGFRNTSHPRDLAGMLLSDYVFAQDRHATERVVTLLLDEIGLRHVVRSPSRLGASEGLRLPDRAGRQELVIRAFDLLEAKPEWDYALRLTEVLRGNARTSELRTRWLESTLNASGSDRLRWLRFGLWLGVLAKIENSVLEELTTIDGKSSGPALALVLEAGHVGFVEGDEARSAVLVETILGNQGMFPGLKRLPDSGISALCLTLSSPAMEASWTQHGGVSFGEVLARRRGPLNQLQPTGVPTVDQCVRVYETFREHAQLRFDDWGFSLAPWDDVIEAARVAWGDCWMLMVLASTAAGITAKEEKALEASDLFDDTVSLARRARYARLRAGTVEWWRRTLRDAPSNLYRSFALTIALRYASQKTLYSVLDEVSSALSQLEQHEVDRVVRAIKPVRSSEGGRMKGLTNLPLSHTAMTDRLVVVLGLVSTRSERWEAYVSRLNNYKGDDATILRFMLETELGRGSRQQPIRWTELAAVAARAYASGVSGVSWTELQPWGPPRSSSRAGAMPAELALAVTDHADEYPMGLVGIAESRAREMLAESIVPVADAARDGQWFQAAAL